MPELFVLRERRPGETRVAATPETVKRLIKEGMSVTVETGAGEGACLSDKSYQDAGAKLGSDPSGADIVVTLGPPPEDLPLKSGAVLIGFISPYKNPQLVQKLAQKNVSTLAMELVPRITRAQAMDALSSQASIAGYKAVILAAARLPKYFPLLMTAAGTIQPARVVVLGAGVAGLQAIATAKRMGAVVEASDVRPSVKEQVESLGGKFIEVPMAESGEGKGGYAKEVSKEYLEKQRALVAERIRMADVVISTALVPGKPAPRLVTADMVKSMRRGSVIVDLAVELGGNCELSVCGEEVVREGVLIIGHPNLPATLPTDASTLFARNVMHLILHIAPKGNLKIDPQDEVMSGTLLTHGGAIVHEAFADKKA
ncbi:MAG: Re/Si-specific NAD(P)(+) transhydrogenase subunit alpha [Deltaproteobacteria bacterium]|nr:Re/Si-specific NAD(P)(+) transhydrogenase subunit alpha [Deltaproteobacteria bacterium]